jgi:hypothetical protein
MTVAVPKEYVLYLKVRRTVYLCGLLGVCGVLLYLARNSHISALYAILIMPAVSLLLSLCINRDELVYNISPQAVLIRSRHIGNPTGLAGAAPYCLVRWGQDEVVEAELSHWRHLPALRIRTGQKPRETYLPLNPGDVDAVIGFLDGLSPASTSY